MRWAPRLSSPKADATAVGYTKWNLANLPRYRQTPWRESLAFQRRVKSEDVDALLVFLHAFSCSDDTQNQSESILDSKFSTTWLEARRAANYGVLATVTRRFSTQSSQARTRENSGEHKGIRKPAELIRRFANSCMR